MSKIKILMTGPAPQVRGGISTFVEAYLASDLPKRVDSMYLSTHVDSNRLVKFLIAIKAYLKFPLICFIFRPHIVHIHISTHFSFYRKLIIFAMAKMLKRHTYIHLHGALFMSFYDANKVNAIFIRTILNKASAVIVLSETWRKWVLSHSHAKNVFVLFNTVDTSAYKDLIPWEREVSVQKILFMGIIGERKGTYDIIKLIPHIVKVYPNVRFVFAGNGEINKAQMLCKRMGILDKVEFPGWVGGNVKKKYYAEATVYLLPSYNEGFPLSVLEAMAAGLPVITTRVGGISDIVEDNVNGYLINPGDIEAMKNRLFLLLSHQDIRERFGKANKLKAKEFFDVKVIANQLYDLYSSIKIFY